MTEAMPRMLPRSVDATLTLAKNGQSEVAIIYPSVDPQYKILAESLASIIEQYGGALPELVADTTLMPSRQIPLPREYRQRPLIMMGNLTNNQAIMTPYARFYCITDAAYPGGDGFDLRTIANPYGTGNNMLLVGGSTLKGVENAVTRLQSYIEAHATQNELILPFILDVDLDPILAQQLENWPETPLGVPLPSLAHGMKIAWGFTVLFLRAIGAYGIMYSWTGDERYGIYARDCLRQLNDMMDDTYGDWHYRAERVMRVLPILSSSGLLTDEDVNRTDELLLGTAIGTADMWWRMRSSEPPLGHRHHGKGTYEFLLMARYLFEHGRPNEVARKLCQQWIEECQTFMDALAIARIGDQDDETSLNNQSTLYWYALGEERYEFFENDSARLIAERMVAVHDSMGAASGWGGYGDSHSGVMYLQNEATTAVASCAFYYQDGRYKWIMESMPNLDVPLRFGFLDFAPPFLHKFDTGNTLAPTTPDGIVGLQMIPATPHQLTLNNHPPLHIENKGHMVNAPETWILGEGIGRNTLPAEYALDKVVMRRGFEKESAYLLLQGYQGGYRWQGFMQAVNCIVRFTQHGHIFLLQNTGKQSPFHKNGLFISDGYNNTTLPPFAEWLATVETDHIAMSATRVSDNHCADWTRHIFWSKPDDGFFVVLDSVITKKTGPYSITCSWRTPAYAELHDRTWNSDQGQHRFTLRMGEILQATSMEEPEQGASRPYVLRQVKAGDYEANTHITFHNIFYVRARDEQETLDIKRVDSHMSVITQDDIPYAACIIGTINSPLAINQLEIQAHNVWITESNILVGGFTHFSIPNQNWHLESDQALALIIDIEKAEAYTYLDNAQLKTASLKCHHGEETMMYSVDTDRQTIPLPNAVQQTLPQILQEILHSTVPAVSTIQAEIDQVQTLQESGWLFDWRYTSDTYHHRRIRQATVTAEPPPSDGFADQLLDTMLPERRESWQQWPTATDYNVQIDLQTAPYVDHVRIVADSTQEPTLRTFNPLPDAIKATILVDGKSRKIYVDQPRELMPFKRYRDMEDQLESLRFDVEQRVSQLKLHFPAPDDRPFVLHEIELYGEKDHPADVVHWVIADIDADGNEEICLANSERELILLNTDGTMRWKHTLSNQITHISCHALDQGEQQSICVGVLGGELCIFDPTGECQLSVNLAEQFHQRTDAYQGWLNTIHEIVVWHRDSNGHARLAVGGYAIIAFIDEEGTIVGHSWVDGSWVFDMLVTSYSTQSPGALWVRNGWNHGIAYYEGRTDIQPSGEAISFGGVQQPMFRMLRHIIPFVTGKTLAFQWLSEGQTILAAVDAGFGILSTTDYNWIWKIEGGTPLTACIMYEDAVITGGEDGFVAAFDVHSGEAIIRRYLGARVVALASTSSGVVVATRQGIHLLDDNWNTIAFHNIDARDIHILDGDAVLILRADQTIEKLVITLTE